jgi:catechol 2,3-dioxygenase-like lactoylglutathione lyase family enzyme
MDIPGIDGFGHIDLTVTDVDRTVQWWEDVMGFRLVNARDTPSFKLRSSDTPLRILHWLHDALGAGQREVR